MGGRIACDWCGAVLEHRRGRLPCEELAGWITLSYWKGREEVDHFNFCSPACLRGWIESQCPSVPEVFLRSFEEEDLDL